MTGPTSQPIASIEIPPEPRAIRSARAQLTEALSDLRAVERSDVLIVVSEVAGAMSLAASSPITIDVFRNDDGIVLELRGDGIAALDPVAGTLIDELTTVAEFEPGLARVQFATSSVVIDREPDDVLFDRLRSGDVRVREQLAHRYAGLARSIAARYAGGSIQRDDAEQVAALALVKALDRFDPGHGAKFATYASRTIDGELKRHLRDKGWSVRVPRGLQELGLEARDEAARFAQEEGRQPTFDEVADALEADENELGQALLARHSYDAASLDAPVGGDEQATALVHTIPIHQDRLRMVPEWADLSSVLDELPERERVILYLRFFEDLSQAEIADRVGISQMHVSRLLRRSIAELRELIGLTDG